MIFNRAELKSKAKDRMRGRYWNVFAACILVTVIISFLGVSSSSGFSSGINAGLNFIFDTDTDDFDNSYHGGQIIELPDGSFLLPEGQYVSPGEGSGFVALLIGILLGLGFFFVIALIVSTVKVIFISNPLNVGLMNYLLRFRDGDTNVKGVFEPFINGRYLKIVGVTFLTDIIISLWSLLFVIPGIYFSYAYSLVRFICADNPDVSSSEARRLSKLMTDGYKFRIFVMGLSFIGWRFLGGITVIGNMFVDPYYYTTMTEMYVELRDNAVASGKIKPEELGISPVGEEILQD